MSEATDPVSIRPLNPLYKGEMAWVYSTLLRELRAADPSGLPDDYWFTAHRAWLEDTLRDPTVVALVAHASDDPNDLLGYAIGRPNEVLEWVHVRKQFRRRGLAARLLTELRCGPSVPTRWRTRMGSDRLANPWRPRELRSK